MIVSQNFATVSLTAVDEPTGQNGRVIVLSTARLLSYEQHPGYTRLRLSGGGLLNVRKGTDEIYRRVRLASTHVMA